MVELANTIWADGPSGAPLQPAKSKIRQWGTYLESLANLAFSSGRVYASKAVLLADLTPGANLSALVIGDATAGNDGLYMKNGGTGTGSWTQLLDFVPGTQFVTATDAGAGTANAIQVTTDLALSPTGRQIVALSIFENNTGPATVRFNGVAPDYPIKTNSGNDLAANYLVAGSEVLGRISGSNFQLFTDISSAADRAAAEAAAAAAEAAAASINPALFLTKADNLASVADKVAALGNLNFQRTPGSGTFAIISALAKMSQRADLRDWDGLDLTGVNDNATLVQAAVNAMAAAGVKLNVPAGKIVLGSTIAVPAGVNIEGPGQPVDRNGTLSAYNAYFHLAHTDVGFNLKNPTPTGLGPRRLAGFGTYRDQPAAGGGWTPLAASADVQVTGVYDAVLEDLFLYNPTRAITVTGDTSGAGSGNGRLTIRNIRGQPMFSALDLTHIYDTSYFDNIHWWPYFSFDANILAYMKANVIAMSLKRVDWPMIGRIFSWGLKYGLYFDTQASVGLDGSLPGGRTIHLKADVVGVDDCQEGLHVTAGTNPIFSIDHLVAGSASNSPASIVTILGDNCQGYIGKLYGYNSNKSLVQISTGSNNKLTIADARSSGMDADASGDAEFSLAGTTNILSILAKPSTSAATVYSSSGGSRIRSPDWVNYTPTVSASTGTITTVGAIAAGDCKGKLEGTTFTFDYTVTITTNGTGAGTLQFTMPYAAKKVAACSIGRTGTSMLVGIIQSAAARLDMNKYDGTYPGADATTIRVCGSYEIA